MRRKRSHDRESQKRTTGRRISQEVLRGQLLSVHPGYSVIRHMEKTPLLEGQREGLE